MKGLIFLVLFASFSFFLQLLPLQLSMAETFPQFTYEMDNSEKGRKEYAKKLKARIEKIYSSIPTPSPKKTEWILKELKTYNDTNDDKIYQRLNESNEFAFYRAKDFLKEFDSFIAVIIKSNSVEAEMLGWVVLIESLFASRDDWSYVHKLYTKRYIDEKLIASDISISISDEYSSFDITFANNFEAVSRQIISNILRPYFEKKIATK